MSAIILPDKWLRQPTGPVEIDWTHPAARALISVGIPTLKFDPITREAWSDYAGDVATVGSAGGVSWQNAGNTNSSMRLADSAANSTSKAIIVSIVDVSASSGDYSAVSKRVDFGQGWLLMTRFSGLKGNNYPTFAFNDGVGWRSTTGTMDIRGTGPRTLVGAYDGTTVRCFVDGIPQGESSHTGSLPDTIATLKVCGDGESTTVGRVSVAYMIDGNKITADAALSRELSLAPWAIFKKKAKILYFPSAGGGGATDIAGALESISLSTFGATVGSARDIAGALEALSLAPYAATVGSARAITAAVESISLGTYAATVSRDTALAGGLESIALTANPASVTLGAAIAAAMEAIVLAANPAAVALDAAIAAQIEAITITGLGATVSTSSDVNIGAALESITLSVPQALVSSNRDIAGGLESIQITANGATVTLGALIQAALESIALQSFGAGITLNVALTGGLEQINLTALAAQIGLGSNVAALVEAITLTPHGATLTMTGEIAAALESIGLTTFAATVVGGESALTTPGLEFTIPVGRMHYAIPIGRIHFTIPRD